MASDNIEPEKREKLYFLNKNPNPAAALGINFIAKEIRIITYKYGTPPDNQYKIIKVSKLSPDGKRIKLIKDGLQCAVIIREKFSMGIKEGTVFEMILKYHRHILGFETRIIKKE